MTHERKRQFYLVAVGVAGLALVIDRVWLRPGETGPARAGAEPVVTEPERTAGETPATPPAQAGRGDIADRLQRVAADHLTADAEAADAFRVGQQAVADQRTAQALEQQLARTFAETHKVTLILGPRGRPEFAVVDGIAMKVGQDLDGFVLAEIRDDGVLFRRESISAELKVVRDPSSENTRPR